MIFLYLCFLFSTFSGANEFPTNYDEAQLVVNESSATSDCKCYAGLDTDPSEFIKILRSGEVYNEKSDEEKTTK